MTLSVADIRVICSLYSIEQSNMFHSADRRNLIRQTYTLVSVKSSPSVEDRVNVMVGIGEEWLLDLVPKHFGGNIYLVG